MKRMWRYMTTLVLIKRIHCYLTALSAMKRILCYLTALVTWFFFSILLFVLWIGLLVCLTVCPCATISYMSKLTKNIKASDF